MQCRRILLVVDSPEGLSRALIHKVAQLAVPFDAEVEVFDSVFAPALVDHRKIHDAIERRRCDLELTADALRAEHVRAYATVRWAYPPREGIREQLQECNPDLLIMRSWRHSRLARALFSYSDYKLIETASCPILLVKNDEPYENARVIAAIDPMHAHDKSALLDEKIIDVAATVARALKLPLHVYHALSLLPPGLPSAPTRLRDLPTAIYEDMCGAWEAKTLSRVQQLAQSVQVPKEHVHISAGDAAELLPEFVAANRADLLVMGAISRSWLRKALIGYTAERVLDRTDCDLLIVKLPA